MTHSVLSRIRRFLKGNRGSVSAEAVLVLPLVLWAYLATYTYYDAFGTVTRNMKATYTIADLISRQAGTVTPSYIDGLNSLYAYLNHNPPGAWTRVTCISWDPNAGSAGEYYVSWSWPSGTVGSHPRLNDDSLQSYVPGLPTISEGDQLIMVETHMTFRPIFQIVGMQEQTFTQTVITRPRISPQVAADLPAS